jgi:phosphohistidine phosphatase
MNKELVLLRHAKAIPEHAGGDFLRPLAPKGIHQAQAVAASFRAAGWQPGITYASAATRTLQTAQILEANLGPCNIIIDENLYLATPEQIIRVIAAAPPRIHRVLLVGHNPGISAAGSLLLHDQHLEMLATAGWVTLSLQTPEWLHITAVPVKRLPNP